MLDKGKQNMFAFDLKKLYQYIIFVIIVCFNAALVALALKVSVGVDSWAAFSQSMADLCSLKVGTMEMILNCLCVFLQLCILKKKFSFLQLLQIPLSVIIGIVINYVYYEVLVFDFTNYLLRLVIICLFYIASAFSVAAIMLMDKITYPLEGLCMAISKNMNISFHVLRQWVDIICIALSIFISLYFSLPFIVREGTIIGMLLFGPVLGFAMKHEKKYLMKMHLIEE